MRRFQCCTQARALDPDSTLQELQQAMAGHVLTKAELTGHFAAQTTPVH